MLRRTMLALTLIAMSTPGFAGDGKVDGAHKNDTSTLASRIDGDAKARGQHAGNPGGYGAPRPADAQFATINGERVGLPAQSSPSGGYNVTPGH